MEIERRFLLSQDIDITTLTKDLHHKCIQQGYIYINEYTSSCVRVRIIEEHAFLTIKKAVTDCSAEEFEYPIPYNDALYMLTTMREGFLIKKNRYYYTNTQGLLFEIDVFMEENNGLVIVEVELPCEDYMITLPPWIGLEITSNKAYSNVQLSRYPYTLWTC